MYNIPHFKADDEQQVIEFIKAHPFVTICGVDVDGKPVATHIPVLIEERNGKLFIQGHIMRKQQHTTVFENNKNVLVIFSGSNAYISASSYAQQNIASTWNYQAVHVSGLMKFTDDIFLYNLLVRLTDKFENNPDSPSLVSKISKEYMQQNMKAIIGFEIEVTDMQHVFKLSQNRDAASKKNIIEHLENSENKNDNSVAATMKEFYTTKNYK